MHMRPTAFDIPVRDRIKQRRSQMLVHSYLYYHLDRPIVSDNQWQAWADELAWLQDSFPEECPSFYQEAFADWTGTTGYHLPNNGHIDGLARYLLRQADRYVQTRVGWGPTFPAHDGAAIEAEKTRQAALLE